MTRLAIIIAALSMQGCIATYATAPNGMTLARISIGSDVDVSATTDAHGALEVHETQAAQAFQSFLQSMMQAATRLPVAP